MMDEQKNTPVEAGVLDARQRNLHIDQIVSQSEQSGKNNNDLFGFPAGVMLHG